MFNYPIFLNPNVTGKKWTELQNSYVFVNIFEQLQALALERYDVDGLPETVDKRVLKLALLWYGSVCVYTNDGSKDADSIIALPALPGATYTIYGDPSDCYVYAKNGMISESIPLHIHGADKNRVLGLLTGGGQASEGRGVMIWENERRFPFIRYVMQFANAMADCLRTIDVARTWIKVPMTIVCDESQVPTVRKYVENIKRNDEFIIGVDRFRSSEAEITPITTASEGAKTALELYDWYANKFYELCGFASNAQVDKKGENLIQAEITMNNEIEDANLEKTVATLNRYAEYANEYLNTNLKFVTQYKNEQTNLGGEDNGQADDEISGFYGRMADRDRPDE